MRRNSFELNASVFATHCRITGAESALITGVAASQLSRRGCARFATEARPKRDESAMGQFAALRKQKIEGFEELNEVVVGTRREVVQLEHGKIKGEIAHGMIGDLPISAASF